MLTSCSELENIVIVLLLSLLRSKGFFPLRKSQYLILQITTRLEENVMLLQ